MEKVKVTSWPMKVDSSVARLQGLKFNATTELDKEGTHLASALAEMCKQFVQEFNGKQAAELLEFRAIGWGLVALGWPGHGECMRLLMNLPARDNDSISHSRQWFDLQQQGKLDYTIEDADRLVDVAMIDQRDPLKYFIQACRIYSRFKPSKSWLSLLAKHVVAIRRARSTWGYAFLGPQLTALVERVLLSFCWQSNPPTDNAEWLRTCARVLLVRSATDDVPKTLLQSLPAAVKAACTMLNEVEDEKVEDEDEDEEVEGEEEEDEASA
jgi:hypothetical protein